MGVVNIGGRALTVPEATCGFVLDKLIPWRESLPATEALTEADAIQHGLNGILLYVGGSDPSVTLAWLREHVAYPPHETLARCVAASRPDHANCPACGGSGKVKEPGES